MSKLFQGDSLVQGSRITHLLILRTAFGWRSLRVCGACPIA